MFVSVSQQPAFTFISIAAWEAINRAADILKNRVNWPAFKKRQLYLRVVLDKFCDPDR